MNNDIFLFDNIYFVIPCPLRVFSKSYLSHKKFAFKGAGKDLMPDRLPFAQFLLQYWDNAQIGLTYTPITLYSNNSLESKLLRGPNCFAMIKNSSCCHGSQFCRPNCDWCLAPKQLYQSLADWAPRVSEPDTLELI